MFRKKQETPREITAAEENDIIIKYLERISAPYGDSEMTPAQMIMIELALHRERAWSCSTEHSSQL